MLKFEQIKLDLLGLEKDITELKKMLNIDLKQQKILELEKLTMASDFWDNSSNSQNILQKINSFKVTIENYNKLIELYQETITLIDISLECDDEDSLQEIMDNFDLIKKYYNEKKLATLLTGEYDDKNAIISFHSGAGGTEAQDWVEMLYRMYCRWADRHNCKVTTIDYLAGSEAGIKSATILIQGENAYGFLKAERGVHRLVRISPFDSSGSRHTSFASLDVMPEIDDDVNIDIKDDNLKIDTYRAGGAGGQHVNKTESAVRITHIPTGVVVTCQNERSQHKNKDMCMKMLKSKLVEIKEREHLDKIEDIKGEQKEIGWGSQIRSYVFMPYTLVKDHRTNFENGNVNAVMDGDLDGFINAYLTDVSSQNIEA